MLEPVTRAGAASSGAVDPPRTTGDWADEALSWASPDGLVLHAVQPVLAQGLRQSGVGQGTEWGRSLQRVLDDPRAVSSFQGGLRQGVFNGAKGLVEGAWALAKGVGSLAYNENPVGSGLDFLRHQGVAVPDWAPSAEVVDRKMQAVGEGVANYLSAVGHDPGKLGNDIKGWIGANWDALKADHARAAAQGPAAEAHWWGQVTGRATFEVAAVAVPVTKFATVARAGEALEVALKAGKLGETLAEAARAGKLGELFAAATKAGKLPELVSEARQAGRLPELVAEARKTTGGLQALADKGELTLGDVAGLEKTGKLTTVEAAAARRTLATAKLAEMLRVAPESKAEVDALAQRIAGEFGGRVATAPIKSEARALEKVLADYGGDASRIKDLAHNTIIVGESDVPAVVARLEAAGAKVKLVGAATDPLGYSGVNATIVTRSGLTAEIQVNTAKMIFAKESAPNARAILGEVTYQSIARETGMEGGRGHVLYEQWRSLPPDSQHAQAIARESRGYYAHFR